MPQLFWTIVSVGLFTAVWEFLWYVGWADPRRLPPPHVFLSDLTSQARFFNTAQRWQIGVRPDAGPSPAMAVLITILSSTMRVLAGLGLAAIVSVALGVAIRYFRLIEHLTLPTVTLLAPVSPIAWLPVAIFIFGIGNGPAIFMVFIALFFHMTQRRSPRSTASTAITSTLRGIGKAEHRKRARLVLSLTGLADTIDKRAHELSGGMCRRAAVARALAMRPAVLLMDEPFASLDVQTRAKMQGFLLDVSQASGASVIFVTHHIDEAMALANRVVVLTARPGRIKEILAIDRPRPRDPVRAGSDCAKAETDRPVKRRGRPCLR